MLIVNEAIEMKLGMLVTTEEQGLILEELGVMPRSLFVWAHWLKRNPEVTMETRRFGNMKRMSLEYMVPAWSETELREYIRADRAARLRPGQGWEDSDWEEAIAEHDPTLRIAALVKLIEIRCEDLSPENSDRVPSATGSDAGC